MGMTKEEQAEKLKAMGQFDSVTGLDIVGKAIKGTFDYYGVHGEYKLETDATHIEVLAPGFLDPVVKESHAYHGALVRVIAKSGSDDPLDWSVGSVMITAVKGMKVKDKKGDPVYENGSPAYHDATKLGLIQHFKKATPVDDRVHNGSDKANTNARKKLAR